MRGVHEGTGAMLLPTLVLPPPPPPPRSVSVHVRVKVQQHVLLCSALPSTSLPLSFCWMQRHICD